MGTDAVQKNGMIGALQVVTVGALFKGPISTARGCDEEKCQFAPEAGLTNSDGTGVSVPLVYLTMAFAYTVRTYVPYHLV